MDCVTAGTRILDLFWVAPGLGQALTVHSDLSIQLVPVSLFPEVSFGFPKGRGNADSLSNTDRRSESDLLLRAGARTGALAAPARRAPVAAATGPGR